jgi:activator of HSP90 ATPase
MAESIQQSVVYKAKAERLYDILLDSKEFAAFTGGREANIEPTPGGAFSMFGGHITGRNVELVPGKRIVQAWRAVNWPEGTYSIVRFDLADEGSGARLTLTHTGYPEEHHAHLASGWQAQYFDPLRAYLA